MFPARCMSNYGSTWSQGWNSGPARAGTCGTCRNGGTGRLSDYMIPILRKDEIEEGAEELLRAFCPNAATDRREHDPFVLAKRMGLNVERLPLYGRPHTLSMLFFCPETGDGAGIPGHIKGRSSLSVSCDAAWEHHPHQYPGGPPGTSANWRSTTSASTTTGISCSTALQHMHNNDVSALRTRRAVGHGQQGQQEPPAVARMAGKSRQLWADDAAVHDARPGAGRGSQPGRL